MQEVTDAAANRAGRCVPWIRMLLNLVRTNNIFKTCTISLRDKKNACVPCLRGCRNRRESILGDCEISSKLERTCRQIWVQESCPGKLKPNKGTITKSSSKFEAHFCEFWCFSLGKQARFTSNFCSGFSPREKFMNFGLFFGLVCRGDGLMGVDFSLCQCLGGREAEEFCPKSAGRSLKIRLRQRKNSTRIRFCRQNFGMQFSAERTFVVPK